MGAKNLEQSEEQRPRRGRPIKKQERRLKTDPNIPTPADVINLDEAVALIEQSGIHKSMWVKRATLTSHIYQGKLRRYGTIRCTLVSKAEILEKYVKRPLNL